MKSEIIKSDNRLLLFRAMQYGLDSKRLDEAFLITCKKEGSQLSFAFAKRYYNVVYEAYLRHASHCVLGIINIELIEVIEASHQLLHDAVDVLLKQRLIGTFREGWSRILRLVRYARAADGLNGKTVFEWEKEFAESLSAEPGRRWLGDNEYRDLLLHYKKKSRG